MKEKVGQLEEAAEILFEIQVETAATLTRRTRAALIIDQVLIEYICIYLYMYICIRKEK